MCDRLGVFVRNDRNWSLGEELRGTQDPTHFGRILQDLGIGHRRRLAAGQGPGQGARGGGDRWADARKYHGWHRRGSAAEGRPPCASGVCALVAPVRTARSRIPIEKNSRPPRVMMTAYALSRR